MKITKVDNLERFYSIYSEKNSILQEYGFPTLDFYELENIKDSVYCLKAKNDEILYFVKNKEGFSNSCNYVLSHLCVANNVDKSLSDEIRTCFKGWMCKGDIGHVSFLVEGYLDEENSFIRRLSLIREHFTTRLINRDINRSSRSKKERFKNIDGFQIRPFELGKDEANFVSIFNETFSHLCEPITIKEITKWVRDSKFNPSCCLFAQISSEIIGFIAIEIDPKEEPGCRFSYLQEIGVKEKLRKLGIGKMLIEEGFRAATSAGSNRMGVGVLDRSRKALTFFEKKGFVEMYKKIYWKLL